ncbi:MAG TPA: hypothetical protein VH187_13680 [Scandinavium sp.]|jgi:hypothetical protein|uniref:hypothetical protein n=1 Tax=Scandinavium sp. TaxID=2830653 RepID=UPI002E378754|nr:hypothetical protein [Scandinavium sp.]HEX4502182.1 hypothetical protein [Scandinavium sp.]
MTYLAIANLAQDVEFNERVSACVNEQSETFVNDTRPDIVALAMDCLRSNNSIILTFIRMAASSPGMADSAADDDGTVISSRIQDEQILSAIQGYYPRIAALYFDAEGNRIPIA